MLKIVCLDLDECGLVCPYIGDEEDFAYTCPDCHKLAILAEGHTNPLVLSNDEDAMDKLLIHIHRLLAEVGEKED